jgi:hypothetical protein
MMATDQQMKDHAEACRQHPGVVIAHPDTPLSFWGPRLRKDWFSLPLSIRQRYWKETDYDTKPPSEDLTVAIDRYIKRQLK